MDLRVAIWNLNQRGAPTWDRLSSLRADVVLVQEARPPANWSAPEPLASWPPHHLPERWVSQSPRKWSAGVIVLNPRFSLVPRPEFSGPVEEPSDEHRRQLGTLAVADVGLEDVAVLTVASAYAMFQMIPETGQQDSYLTMNSILDELAPLIEQPRSRIVIGGDFNSWLHSPYAASEPYQAVFDRLASLGMHDCIRAKASDTQRTRCPAVSAARATGALTFRPIATSAEPIASRGRTTTSSRRSP
jgi:hypothetical protein